MYYVYILENPSGKLYIGQTDNLERRFCEHNDTSRSKSKFTSKQGPCTLVWRESHSTRSSAMRREKQIKAMKSKRWIEENLLNR